MIRVLQQLQTAIQPLVMFLTFLCFLEWREICVTCGIVSRWIFIKGRVRVRKSNARWGVQEQDICSWTTIRQLVTWFHCYCQKQDSDRLVLPVLTCLDSKHTGLTQAQEHLSSPGMVQAPATAQTQRKSSQALNNARTQSLNVSLFKRNKKRSDVSTYGVS